MLIRTVIGFDLHESVRLFMDPEVNILIVATLIRVEDPDDITGLGLYRLFIEEAGSRPVEKAKRDVFVGDVSSLDLLTDFTAREGRHF